MARKSARDRLKKPYIEAAKNQCLVCDGEFYTTRRGRTCSPGCARLYLRQVWRSKAMARRMAGFKVGRTPPNPKGRFLHQLPPSAQPLLSTAEVAHMLSTTIMYTRQLRHYGHGPLWSKRNRRVVYRIEDVQSWAHAHPIKARNRKQRLPPDEAI